MRRRGTTFGHLWSFPSTTAAELGHRCAARRAVHLGAGRSSRDRSPSRRADRWTASSQGITRQGYTRVRAHVRTCTDSMPVHEPLCSAADLCVAEEATEKQRHGAVDRQTRQQHSSISSKASLDEGMGHVHAHALIDDLHTVQASLNDDMVMRVCVFARMHACVGARICVLARACVRCV